MTTNPFATITQKGPSPLESQSRADINTDVGSNPKSIMRQKPEQQKKPVEVKQVTEEEYEREDWLQSKHDSSRAAVAPHNDAAKVVAEEDERLTLMNKLLELLTGLDASGRGKISLETKSGESSRRNLVVKTREYRFRIIKQMAGMTVELTQGRAQTLQYLLNDFSEQLHTEIMNRKNKKEVYGP